MIKSFCISKCSKLDGYSSLVDLLGHLIESEKRNEFILSFYIEYISGDNQYIVTSNESWRENIKDVIELNFSEVNSVKLSIRVIKEEHSNVYSAIISKNSIEKLTADDLLDRATAAGRVAAPEGITYHDFTEFESKFGIILEC